MFLPPVKLLIRRDTIASYFNHVGDSFVSEPIRKAQRDNPQWAVANSKDGRTVKMIVMAVTHDNKIDLWELFNAKCGWLMRARIGESSTWDKSLRAGKLHGTASLTENWVG